MVVLEGLRNSDGLREISIRIHQTALAETSNQDKGKNNTFAEHIQQKGNSLSRMGYNTAQAKRADEYG
jgi:hypothetical protein